MIDPETKKILRRIEIASYAMIALGLFAMTFWSVVIYFQYGAFWGILTGTICGIAVIFTVFESGIKKKKSS